VTRRVARARLTARDQARVAALAEQYGQAGITLTVWLLAQETDGWPVELALDTFQLAHDCRTWDGYDPTVRDDGEGHQYTVCTIPWTADAPPATVLPPVLGIATWTLLRPGPPPSARLLIEARAALNPPRPDVE